MRKPEWLRVKLNAGRENQSVMQMLRQLHLNTVCEEANCPNSGECFGKKTAAFMILGSNCTRNCGFCTVGKGPVCAPDPAEPAHVSQAVARLGLRHVVITSVTRDDLSDGGASHFAAVIKSLREMPDGQVPVIEVLIPDFQGDAAALQTVIDARPDIINHNIETIPRLYPTVRPQAIYQRSLDLLRRVKERAPDIVTKSGIMVGLGESFDEVLQVFRDLRRVGCELLTVGQYLSPSRMHLPVVDYIHPDVFADYQKQGEALGFKHVASGPLVRSSYMAEQAFVEAGLAK
jgi:lipoic acid synthetase